jgi:pyridoxal/pyridoxine/pyridoxamine kinase
MGGRDDLLSEELIKNIDIISPNETELERIITSVGFSA